MIRRIFLGPAFHWLIVLAIIGMGWFSGLGRIHVSQFNTFLIVLIAVTIAVLIAVVRSSPRGTQVTRDPLPDFEQDAAETGRTGQD